jgi:hypothetical protein
MCHCGSAPRPPARGRRGRSRRRRTAMETIEVDGLRIAYERAGAGPPLVLLHGYVGDGPTTWRRQLDGLGDDFTVIAWDAPGAGRSSDPPESFGMAGYADCLAAWARSSRRCSPRPRRHNRSMPSPPACSGSTRLASGPWPGPRPRTSAMCSPDRRPDPAGVRRPGRARPPERGRGPPPGDRRLDPGRPPRRQSCLQHRSPEAFNRALRMFLHDHAIGEAPMTRPSG